MHALTAFVCTEIKLKSVKPIYHWIRLFMESKIIFISCLYIEEYVRYGCLFTIQKNNINGCHFLVGMAFFFVNTEEYREYYTLIDLPVHGAQIEPGPIFIACFNHEL